MSSFVDWKKEWPNYQEFQVIYSDCGALDLHVNNSCFYRWQTEIIWNFLHEKRVKKFEIASQHCKFIKTLHVGQKVMVGYRFRILENSNSLELPKPFHQKIAQQDSSCQKVVFQFSTISFGKGGVAKEDAFFVACVGTGYVMVFENLHVIGKTPFDSQSNEIKSILSVFDKYSQKDNQGDCRTTWTVEKNIEVFWRDLDPFRNFPSIEMVAGRFFEAIRFAYYEKAGLQQIIDHIVLAEQAINIHFEAAKRVTYGDIINVKARISEVTSSYFVLLFLITSDNTKQGETPNVVVSGYSRITFFDYGKGKKAENISFAEALKRFENYKNDDNNKAKMNDAYHSNL